MKKVVSGFMAMLMLLVSIPGASAQQTSSGVLRRGTPISVQLTSIAASNKKNDVTAVVANDVFDRETNAILVKRGTPVFVGIDRVKSKGMGKGGSIAVNAISTTAVDGRTIMLMGNMQKNGDNTGTALTLGLVMGILVLPGLGFLFFLLHGEKVKFPPNTIIPNVAVADDYQIAL